MNLNSQAKANKNPSHQRMGASGSFCSSVSSLRRFPRCRGLTLVELMVAAGVGSLVLTAIAIIFTTSARSFASMSNYVNMNGCSRNALDRMTREIRRAGNLTDFASTTTAAQLKFLKGGTTNSYVNYQWDADSRQLTEWTTGSATTNVLLTECDELAFTLCKSSLATTTDPAAGKAISVSWKCSRTILGKKTTTESIQQALIIIRNKQ